MEEGDLEGLATTVPQELVEYVLQDNAAFTAECAEWDKAQELRKKQEALMVKKQQQPETAVADSSNDIEVSCGHAFCCYFSRCRKEKRKTTSTYFC